MSQTNNSTTHPTDSVNQSPSTTIDTTAPTNTILLKQGGCSLNAWIAVKDGVWYVLRKDSDFIGEYDKLESKEERHAFIIEYGRKEGKGPVGPGTTSARMES